jgi:hypothetical protein
VTYPDLWDGITLTYDAPEGGIVRSTYMLAPYASVDSIRLRYNAPVTVNSDGTLSAMYGRSEVTETAPVAWQEMDGQRVPVEVAFAARGPHEVGFELGEYDPRVALVIDPVLTWNTFLGGGLDDQSTGIAVDASGNVYVVGYSSGPWGTPVRPFGSEQDAFAAKLDSNGNLIWNTFLGGEDWDIGRGIAVDGSGNVYVAGISTGTWGTPVRAKGDWDDGFAAKLDSNGGLVWNTFLGGDGFDHGTGVAVDGSGNVLVAGISGLTWGTPVRAFSGLNDDAFAAKLASNGALTWNTFLGGNGVDHGRGISVDGSGNVYVAGISGATWGSPVRPFGSFGDDAFAAKLGSDGALKWNTFLGGDLPDHGIGIAVDGSGNVYVVGTSTTTWGTPVRPYSSSDDAFAVKLASNGALTWNSFLGGDDVDEGGGIAVDGSGNVYVVGYSRESWGFPVRIFTGSGDDAFAVKLDSGGAVMGNTFLGSSNTDRGTAISADAGGSVYVTGNSGKGWGAPIRPYDESWDVYVAKLPALAACAAKPEEPLLVKPGNGKSSKNPQVKLDWTDSACVQDYKVLVKEGAKNGPVAFKKKGWTQSGIQTTPLTPGLTYYWRVIAINTFGKGKSEWRSFTVK